MSRRHGPKGRGTSRARSAARPDVESVERLRELEASPGVGPILACGDIDADRDRDRRYWDLDRKAPGDPSSS